MVRGGRRRDPPAKTQSYLKMKLICTKEVGMPHVHAININEYNIKQKVESFCRIIRNMKELMML
jgi:hypothetical protein